MSTAPSITLTPPMAGSAMNTIQTESLDVLAGANHYNQWILDSFAHALGPKVLEVGCGTGSFTQLLLNHPAVHHVTGVDLDPVHVHKTRHQLLDLTADTRKTLTARVQDVMVSWPDATELGSFDTVVLLNVLEHLPDEQQALQRLKATLKPGGRLVILVPAHQWLYSPYDASIGHRCRYTQASLTAALQAADFEVTALKYFNRVGILGWWWNFCVLKKPVMDADSVGAFELLMPLVRRIEDTLPMPPMGLSVLAVGTKR
jgi:2-polyprenyl-3-methyl-5-hydroxy-6-metoxy-1,4-benzoquinol methylase